MRIAVIRKGCGLNRGGAERYCANLCRCMAELGHEVYVLAEDCDATLHPAIMHVPVVSKGLTSSALNRSFHVNAQKVLATLKVDRVYALSRSWPADAFRVSDPLHSIWLELRYPGRVRNFLERLNPRNRAILDLEKNICTPAHTKVIIANSMLVKKQLLAAYPFPADRIRVVYNGVDLEKFSPKRNSWPRRELQLLFVAQDFRRKGLAIVLEVLAGLKAAALSCRLKVVGGDERRPFVRLAKVLGVTGEVDFVGPSRAVEDCYRAADLLVFPTRSDPFANVCLEALACGCPVVTTSMNGAAEILKEGETGFVVDEGPDMAAQMAARIMAFEALSPDRRKKMKMDCRRSAEPFTILRNARETLAILEDL